jgi:hypothetical protein
VLALDRGLLLRGLLASPTATWLKFAFSSGGNAGLLDGCRFASITSPTAGGALVVFLLIFASCSRPSGLRTEQDVADELALVVGPRLLALDFEDLKLGTLVVLLHRRTNRCCDDVPGAAGSGARRAEPDRAGVQQLLAALSVGVDGFAELGVGEVP